MTGLTLTLDTGDHIVFTEHELRTPPAFREAMYLQTGCVMPCYSQADHELVVGALVALADAVPVASAA